MKKIFLSLLIITTFFLTGCFDSNNIKKKEIPSETKNIIKEYIKKNISDLSPKEAVLGGNFYITKIDFEYPNLVLIEYEDGHIALKASANFKIENGNPKIINFELINEKNPVVTNEYLKCNDHDECVPLPGCHPRECINKKYKDSYEQPKDCTMMYNNCAAYTDNDCICQQGTCFNENLMNQECSQ